jgi:hypothetical protein
MVFSPGVMSRTTVSPMGDKFKQLFDGVSGRGRAGFCRTREVESGHE